MAILRISSAECGVRLSLKTWGMIVLAIHANACIQEPMPLVPQSPPGEPLQLVWSDEFNGTELDSSKWTPKPDGPRKGGWWSPSAVTRTAQGIWQ